MAEHAPPPGHSRRDFLRQISAFAATTGGLGLASPTQANSWQNWSGNQKARPAAIAYPGSETELIALVKNAPGQIRAFGGSHSFSGVAASAGTMISLEALNGIARHDAQALTASIWAGSRIGSLGPALHDIGQALINEADINMQSLGGALSTATHGTGRRLPSYSATIKDLRLVLADGSLLHCSAEQEAELFQAARVGIGSIGIISQATLQNRAPYRLKEEVRVMDLGDALSLVDKEKDQHRHIEFFAFPYGRRSIVKWLNISTEPTTPALKPSFDENEILEWAADTARQYPWSTSWLQRTIGLFVSDSSRVGQSYEIFASPRLVMFNEMEYALPAEHGMACLQEILATIRQKKINVFFPLEFRYVAADNCWLSPFQGRDSATISVHQYYKQDFKELFKVVEPIFWKYRGRPHWGKIHTLRAKNLRTLYPHFDDFLRVRRQADPQGRLLNSHARKLFMDSTPL